MAILSYREGRLNEALGYFDHVLTLNPHHEDTLLASARIIQDEGIDHMNNVAFRRFYDLVQLDKADESVLFNLAMLAMKEKRTEQAKTWLTKAIAKRNDFIEAHYNMALILIQESNSNMVNVRQAVEHLKQVLQLDPSHVKSMLVLGDIYADKLDDVDQARHYYTLATGRTHSFNVKARNNLCVLWYKQNILDECVACFQLLLQDLISLAQPEYDDTIRQIDKQIQALSSIEQKDNKRSNKQTSLDETNLPNVIEKRCTKNESRKFIVKNNEPHQLTTLNSYLQASTVCLN